MTLSLLDVFSGAGGLSQGLEMSGIFRSIASIEYEHAASTTYKTNFPQSHVFEERIENVESKKILEIAKKNGKSKIDVICGGPPCRPFSKANKGNTQWKIISKIRKISEHPDWINFIRLVKDLEPSFVIAENVMGFRTNHEVFLPFVNSLRMMGYSVYPNLFNATLFGIPQTRRRIIIIAAKGSFKQSDLIPYPTVTKPVTVFDAIHDLPRLTNKKIGKTESEYSNRIPSTYAMKLRGSEKKLYNHQVHSVHPVMQKRFEFIPQGYNLKSAWQEKIIPREILCAEYVQRGRRRKYTLKALVNMHGNIYRRIEWKKPSPTLTHPRKSVLIHPSQNRLLSVRECARLQGFPDSFQFYGTIDQQYQQIADAVPPLLSLEIGRCLGKLILEQTSLKLTM